MGCSLCGLNICSEGWKQSKREKQMEPLKHECGVAMVRLLKPLDYYQNKYGTWMYGLNKLYLMMEKQHNRCLLYTSDAADER